LNIRPGIRECLSQVNKNYVIIVYTASHQSYADSVIDYIDPNKEFIKYRLYRHNCVKIKYKKDLMYVKDLRIIRNINMKDMVIIDNSVLSFAFQLDNGIPILPFTDDKNDKELIFLYHYLNGIANCKDLREENKKNLKMDYFYNSAKSESKCSSDEDNTKISTKNEESSQLSPSPFVLKKCDGPSSRLDENSYDNKNIKPFLLTASEEKKTQSDVNISNLPRDNSITDSVKTSATVLPRKNVKKHTIFQDKLISTLDDLKINFK
jgi:Dullard-like phosphatase family protein